MTEAENSTITPEEYRQTVQEIAELVMKSTQAEQYENFDEGIHDITKSHIMVLDVNKAAQVIALSENTPEGFLDAMAPEDDWKQYISVAGRFCLIKDIREEIENSQETANIRNI